MNVFFFIFFLLYSTLIFSQKEANIWYFGKYAGLDFNSGTPVALTDGKLNTIEGCAAISDKNGDLLFYTDGVSVWNKNHSIMLNGQGLLGHISSTHSALIVPQPQSSSIYYIFTVDQHGNPNGFRYSKVDMTLDNGLGGITPTEKNIFMISGPVSEKITAVKHANNQDYWIVSQKFNSNEFIAFKISNSGIDFNPVISKVGIYVGDHFNRTVGAIKISPNGKKIAVARAGYYLALPSDVQVFDFDTSTGIISNPITFYSSIYEYTSLYGVEFSPNSKLLYITEHYYVHYLSQHYYLYQYNLEAGDETAIKDSKKVIYNITNRSINALQLATDEKIYVAVYESEYLDVINNPNIEGINCNYIINGVSLNGRQSYSGLPPFIQSYFNTSFNFENVCFGNTTQFTLTDTVDSAVWDFGDVASGINNTSTALAPTHIFSSPGDYEVSVTVTVGTETATKTSIVTIYVVPTATKPTDKKICDDNNDGVYVVDLTTQNTTILNGQDPLVFNVKYYAGLADFTNEIAITSPNNYTNKNAYTLETIYAKVYNKNNESCFDSTNFTIQVFETPLPSTTISPLTYCDNTSVGTDTDGIILFDLTQKETEILNGQIASNFTVEYYSNASYSVQILNPAAFQNTTNPQTVYVKMFNNGNANCVATTNLSIEVFELPIVTNPVVLKQCDDDTDGYSPFNLTEVENEISTNAIIETITYFKTFAGANTNNTSDKILNPTTYTNQYTSIDTAWARVENTNGCFRVSEIQLIVSTTLIPTNFQRVFYECDDYVDSINDEKDGVTTFDFSSVTSEIVSIFPISQQLIINYYRNEADALAEENPIPDISNYRNVGSPTTQTIYVRVDSQLDNDCLGLGGHITLHVEPIPIANTVTINRQCDDDFDGFFPFDTSTVEAAVLNNQTGMLVSYVDQNGNTLPSPLPNPFLTTSQIITIRVTDSNSQDIDGACFAEITLEFIVDKKPIANTVADFIECDDDLDGQFAFNTSTIEASLLKGQTGMLISYFDENGNALPSPLANPFLTGSQTITAKVENQLNATCFSETAINFTVHPKPEFGMDETDIICLNILPKQLNIFNPKQSNYTFLWTDSSGNEVGNQPTIEITKGGVYTAVATSANGCKSFPQNIDVTESSIATLNVGLITITDDSENNIIAIESHQLGIGDYEFAIQKEGESIGFYQDEPNFENISPGIYSVYVNDKNNCGTISIDVSVIGYSKFFTPNNDGYNDYWNVIGVSQHFYPSSLIYIYNRFGKLVAQIKPASQGWNGFFNGKPLPSSDYWFTVELIDSKGNRRIRKGHFSLLR